MRLARCVLVLKTNFFLLCFVFYGAGPERWAMGSPLKGSPLLLYPETCWSRTLLQHTLFFLLVSLPAMRVWQCI